MDYYLEDRSRLNGQPKRTIADYVESEGILVPRRFDSLREAKRFTDDPFLRSEHEQEYDGVSGLMKSFDLNDSDYNISHLNSIEEITVEFLNNKENISKVRTLKRYTKESLDDFLEHFSFSLWEKIEGEKHVVISDSAIKGKYHIFSELEREKNPYIYFSLENGVVNQIFHGNQEDINMKRTLSLVEIYEQVRHLSNFNPVHCPIMEFASNDNGNYFLQYHRTRDFLAPSFTIDREKSPDEKELCLVRGVTPKEGLNLKLTVHYSFENLKHDIIDIEDEDGALDTFYYTPFTESRLRFRTLQLINPEFSDKIDFKLYNRKFLDGHNAKSMLFKPEISGIISLEDIFLPHECFSSHENYRTKEMDYFPKKPVLRNNQKPFIFLDESSYRNTHINVHIVSDGRKAYIKRI